MRRFGDAALADLASGTSQAIRRACSRSIPFQEAVLRVDGLADVGELLIVAGEAHCGLIKAQLAELGRNARLMVEPGGRDSAPAIAAAARWISRDDPAGVAVVLAADHDVPDAEAFRVATATAAAAARNGAIVTFGVKPTEPSTAYGYILAGAALGDMGVCEIEAFVEKPSAEVARDYLAQGYLWNSGNFVFRVDTFLAELETYAPDIAAAAAAAVENGEMEGSAFRLSDDFLASPKLSVDYAVLEQSTHTAVLPVSYRWSDLGAWDAILAASDRDHNGNAVTGTAELVDCFNTLVRVADDQTVAVVGARDLAVIVEPNGVLICDLASSQSVKQLIERRGAPQPRANRDRIGEAKRELAVEAAALDLWRRGSALPVWSALGFDS